MVISSILLLLQNCNNLFIAIESLIDNSRLAMSKTTTTRKKKPTNETNQEIINDLLESLFETRQATRELTESVDAWKVTTIVFSVISIISLFVAILK